MASELCGAAVTLAHTHVLTHTHTTHTNSTHAHLIPNPSMCFAGPTTSCSSVLLIRCPLHALKQMHMHKNIITHTHAKQHRAHYELFIRALDAPNVGKGGVCLVHPTVGPTQDDDIPGAIRYKTYEVGLCAVLCCAVCFVRVCVVCCADL